MRLYEYGVPADETDVLAGDLSFLASAEQPEAAQLSLQDQRVQPSCVRVDPEIIRISHPFPAENVDQLQLQQLGKPAAHTITPRKKTYAGKGGFISSFWQEYS